MSVRKSDVIDISVGQQVLAARTFRGKNQGQLGMALGVSGQQVQKMEQGINRISAGRLWRMSVYLNVPISFFYEKVSVASGETKKAA